jgi:N-acyl-phosphatidylethanolamine-hydrolysing phospholipase D
MPQVVKPDWGIEQGKGIDDTYKKDVKATWLGHACFLVEFPVPEGQNSERGYRLLFDP